MKLIIDISGEMYDWLLYGFPDDEDNIRLYEAVRAGIPIKEDEGRVIDGVNLDRVIERFTNLLELQRGFFVEVIGAEFTEHELKEIIYLLGELKAYNEHTRTHASDSSEHETHEERTAKVGHWIEYKYAEESEGHLISNFECDKCHAWAGADYDYCPFCGAKMEGTDDRT